MSYLTAEILEGTAQQYVPQMALIFYAADQDAGDPAYYIETRRIRHGVMGAGTPISRECISDIASSFSRELSVCPTGKIPPNLLFADSRPGRLKYIWYNPPGRRHMFFAGALAIPSGQYHVPGIVYAACGERLDVYAFKGEKPQEKLYKAPFFNTTDGAVCLGNSRTSYPQNPSFTDILDYWEKMFWLTEFTHLGGSSNPTRNNLVHVTTQSKEHFDCEELIEMKITLTHLLR